MKNIFKICGCCRHSWNSMEDLIQDRNLHAIGYQAAATDTQDGLFMFTHNVEGCGTTIAIHATQLLCLYDGPFQHIRMSFSEDCNGACLFGQPPETCRANCSMRWARDILKILKNHGPEQELRRLQSSKIKWQPPTAPSNHLPYPA